MVAVIIPIVTSVVEEILPCFLLPTPALLFFGVAVLLARFDRGKAELARSSPGGGNNLIDYPVILGFAGREPVIAIDIPQNFRRL
jgi:hypothetical protein